MPQKVELNGVTNSLCACSCATLYYARLAGPHPFGPLPDSVCSRDAINTVVLLKDPIAFPVLDNEFLFRVVNAEVSHNIGNFRGLAVGQKGDGVPTLRPIQGP